VHGIGGGVDVIERPVQILERIADQNEVTGTPDRHRGQAVAG
jgi:hypothetical protein